MPKIKLKTVFKVICFALCAIITAGVPAVAFAKEKTNSPKDVEMTVLSVWQIDSFEGGKGSRASYLQKIADNFSQKTNCYLTVTAITAEAARMNLENSNIPDIISYGAGTYGIESYLKGKTPYSVWCNGGYCLLTLSETDDFSDVNDQNTVVNAGTGNLAGVAALFEGVGGAAKETPTSAYVKLINGKYKYLLGTQRDIFRLRTRGVAFSIKPVESFNDLYQNISVTSTNATKAVYAKDFISYLLDKVDASSLGLMQEGKALYSDEMTVMEGIGYQFRLTAPVSKEMRTDIETSVLNCDENKLKTLLKSLK